ncbi:hypothetical protein CLU79DRAFT_744232, partial [Phycomyces nitens]
MAISLLTGVTTPVFFLETPFASYALRYVLSSKTNDRPFVYCCLGSILILSLGYCAFIHLDFLQLYGRRQSFVLFTIFLHVLFRDC